MKKILPLGLVVIAAFSYFLLSDEQAKVSVDEPAGATESPIETPASASPKKSATIPQVQKQHVSTSRESASAQSSRLTEHQQNRTTGNEIRNEVKKLIDNSVNDKGVVDLDVLSDAIGVDDFDMVLSLMDENSSEAEVARRYEIEDAILRDSELAAQNYAVACGQGLCALNFQNIPNDRLGEFRQKLKQLNLGSTFEKVLSGDDIDSSIRVITKSQFEKSISVSQKASAIGFSSH